MTREEFIEKANLNDTCTAFVYDSQSNRYQYSEDTIDVFDEEYLEGTANYTIEAIDRNSAVGEVICDNFSNIDQIETDKLIVGHYTADNGIEVYVLLPNAAIFTVVFDDCDTCTGSIGYEASYYECKLIINGRDNNRFDDYKGGVAFIRCEDQDVAANMGDNMMSVTNI